MAVIFTQRCSTVWRFWESKISIKLPPQKKETAQQIKTLCTISPLVIRASGAKRSLVIVLIGRKRCPWVLISKMSLLPKGINKIVYNPGVFVSYTRVLVNTLPLVPWGINFFPVIGNEILHYFGAQEVFQFDLEMNNYIYCMHFIIRGPPAIFKLRSTQFPFKLNKLFEKKIIATSYDG